MPCPLLSGHDGQWCFFRRKFRLLFFTLSQVAWILPMFLLIRINSNEGSWIRKMTRLPLSVINLNDEHAIVGTAVALSPLLSPSLLDMFAEATNGSNSDDEIKARFEEFGFAGPLNGVLHEDELAALPRIWEDWEKSRSTLRGKLNDGGFCEVLPKTCFMWMPDCYQLAKHGGILKIVKQILGPDVLLYGISVWKGQSELLSKYHTDPEVSTCERSLDVVVGSNLRYIKHSEKLTVRATNLIIEYLKGVHKYQEIGLPDRASFIESAGVLKARSFLKKNDVQAISVNAGRLGVVVLNGRGIYRIEGISERTSLLLQFVSAECRVRDGRPFSWVRHRMQKSVLLPPLLSISGSSNVDSLNDVREGPAWQEAPFLIRRQDEARVNPTRKPFYISNITVYDAPSMGHSKVSNYGLASTSILPAVRLHYHSLFCGAGKKNMSFFEESSEALIVVVISGTLLYHRAISDGFEHREVIELVTGSAVYIRSKQAYAFIPVSPEAAIVSICWTSREARYSKGISFSDIFFKSKEILDTFIDAIEGRTVTLNSGQAYDPDTDDCNAILVVVSGSLLEMLPTNTTVKASDVVFIPVGKSCLFWNTGSSPVTFFVTHLCRFEAQADMSWNGFSRATIMYGASGRIMK